MTVRVLRPLVLALALSACGARTNPNLDAVDVGVDTGAPRLPCARRAPPFAMLEHVVENTGWGYTKTALSIDARCSGTLTEFTGYRDPGTTRAVDFEASWCARLHDAVDCHDRLEQLRDCGSRDGTDRLRVISEAGVFEGCPHLVPAVDDALDGR